MDIGITIAAVLAAAVGAGAGLAGEGRPGISGRIMACEQAKDRLVLLDVARDWDTEDAVLWQWAGKGAEGIAAEHYGWFGYPAEAKCVLGGSHVLATFSHGAVALIRLEDKRVQFYANVGGNPHSADLLPDGNIVTASSEGGYLRVFRTAEAFPEPASFWQVPLHDAHGVLWDAKRERVWALGGRELKRYRYDSAKAELAEEAAFAVPGDGEKQPGGHDLQFSAAGDRLILTTMKNVYGFDLTSETFAPYAPIGEVSGVKSVSEQSPGGPVLMMRATEKWWSDTVRFAGDERVKRMPGARFYKARWWRDE